ncbi:Rossmann-fold NAD(P)-binding domain-containing protein [Piscirickettsia litoralis]|uniref:proton-translocating NAD(P)(+) transhydrogenase n=1 Tax=Piscirickettsia litoralis TaxID=1891921 RepID=A0ABX3AC56_9GAMM|nr:hypothetical protein [Piscirickettsia litoralis]ODN43724.1 hypothetical protein BGC07_13490 [Piscirickettsia litoralis]
MKDQYNILIMRESRPGEHRVGLVPASVAYLIEKGHRIILEAGAGQKAGFPDADYQACGATIRPQAHDRQSMQALMTDIDLILRAKRPNQIRENLENTEITKGTIMVGALDPFEPNSNHVNAYKKQGIIAYSIDQLNVDKDHPMNILSAMSKLAGALAFEDALAKFSGHAKTVMVIGSGSAGISAMDAAVKLGVDVTVFLTNQAVAHSLQAKAVKTVVLEKNNLNTNQKVIAESAKHADIIITTARSSGQKAPVLIPESTLDQLKPGTVVIDLALSEGGNVAGSAHDQTIERDNGVLLVNQSAYPKVTPKEASIAWSDANQHFVDALCDHTMQSVLSVCRIS